MKVYKFCIGLYLASLFLPLTILGAPDSVDIFGAYVSRSSTSATISWNTTPHTKAYLSYAGSDGVWTQTPWSIDFLVKHEITLLQLASNSTYLYRIQAEAETGTYNTYSGSFTTLDLLNKTSEQNQPASTGSFEALLSPSPTPMLTSPNIMLQPQQGIQYVPYFIPMQFAITPAPSSENVLGNVVTPTPLVTYSSDTTSNTSTTTLIFILGLLAGIILVTLATHSFTIQRKSKTAPSDKQPKETKEPTKKRMEYNFKVKT